MSLTSTTMISGVKWVMINQLLTQIMTFGVGIVLMIWITPNEYGLIGIALVFSGFLNVFRDFGLGSSIIKDNNVNKDDLDTIFWTIFIIGITLCLILFFSAELISTFFNEDRLLKIVRALSVVYLAYSVSSLHYSLMMKDLEFKHVFYGNFGSNFLASVLAIILAINGFGVWALVAKQLSSSFVQATYNWIVVDYRPSFFWSKSILKKHLNFSLPLIGRKTVNYWSRNSDNFFISKFLGADVLGLYSRSYSIMMLPVSKVGGVIGSVLFPSLSKIQDDDTRVEKIFLKTVRLIGFITIPIMIILSLSSESFVLYFLDDSWNRMIFILKVLCIIGALQSMTTLNSNLFMIKGKNRIDFLFYSFSSIVYVLSFYVTSQHSIELLVQVYAIANIMFFFLGIYVLSTIMDLRFFSILLNITPHVTLGLLIYLCLYYGFEYLSLNLLMNLMLIPLAVISLWLISFWFVKRSVLFELRSIISSINK